MSAQKRKSDANKANALLTAVQEHIDLSTESLADQISNALAGQNQILEGIFEALSRIHGESEATQTEATAAPDDQEAEAVTYSDTIHDYAGLSSASLLQQFEETPETDCAIESDTSVDGLTETKDLPAIRIPEYSPVDPEGMTPEEMTDAIKNQQYVIAALTSAATQNVQRRAILSASQLKELQDGAPERLKSTIERSLESLDKQVRLGELELSLDRARVSRQMCQLEETQERLDARARLLGMTLNEDGTVAESSGGVKKSRSENRHWLSKLGFGH